MWFAKSQIETVEPESKQTPLEKYEESLRELATVDTEMKATDKELRQIFSVHKDPRVHFVYGDNGWSMRTRANAEQLISPEIRAIERRWAELFRKHHQTQAKCARLKAEAGLATYN